MNRFAADWGVPLLFALLFSLIGPAQGLPLDSDQPIHLEADRVEINDASGESVYQGKVALSQGSMRLWADKITAYNSDRGLQRVIAVGNPVRFQQQRGAGEADVHAHAKRMEYQAEKRLIILLHDAELQQGRNTFRSERIEYDMAREAVSATGSSDQKRQGRVEMTIEPKKKTGDRSGKSP
jgi:lipopolysaccharide export system protein LptA